MTMYKLYYDESDRTVVQEPLKAIRIAILGDYGVGKTSLAQRLCQGLFDQGHKTTNKLELYSTTIDIENGKRKVKLELYDTPGMDQYKENTDTIYQTCHGAVIVYDTTEQYSFHNIPNHINSVRLSLPPLAELFLIGAKSDSTDRRQVPFKEADTFAVKHNLSLFETSAKSNSGVLEAFGRVTESIMERLEIGAFDPSTLIVPALTNEKNQLTMNDDSNGQSGRPITPGWSLLCCWI